ncbi:MAG: hypothetical protein MJ153_07205, partial [Clostridia bacterium]|nr:hypothetical protein [Clostridia bacterium]
YRFDAIRYLIKHEPNFNLELCDCLNKAIQLKQIKTKNIKYFDFIDKHIQLNVENIVYIQSDKHYLLYYILVKNDLVCFKKRSKMSEAIEDLSDYCFFSLIRTGLLINLKYVKSINKRGIICIEAGENISKLFIISDSNIDKFLSHYMKYLGDL